MPRSFRQSENLREQSSFFLSAFAPDGKRLIAGGNDGLIELWDLASAQVVLTVKARENVGCHGLFSPDGNVLVVANSYTSVGRPFVQVLRPGTLADIDAATRIK